MDSTTIPLSHIQTGLTIIGLFFTAGAMAFGAAWAGVKLAIEPLKLEISLNKEAYKSEIEAMKEDRKRRGEVIAQLSEAVMQRVMVSSCLTAQAACGRYNSMRIESISKQVDDIAVDVKENTRLLDMLNATFMERTKHFEALENLINERSNNFRPPTDHDLNT